MEKKDTEVEKKYSDLETSAKAKEKTKANLTNKYSPRDLLEQFRKVYVIDFIGQLFSMEVPKKIGEIEKKIKLEFIP